MNKIIVLLIFLCSLFLYLIAPHTESRAFCIICLVFFSIGAYFLIKVDLKSGLYVSFNVLFLLSFFLTTFAYPVFVRGTPADILAWQRLKVIDFDYLPRTIALCLVAISAYFVGYINVVNERKILTYKDKITIRNTHGSGVTNVVKYLYYLVFVVLLVSSLFFIRAGGSVSMSSDATLISLFQILFGVVLLLGTTKWTVSKLSSYVKSNFTFLSLCVIMMLVFTYIGDRGLILSCGLIILFVYNAYVKRMRLWTILGFLLVGVVFMFTIRQTRNTNSLASSSSVSSYVTNASDIIDRSIIEYGPWYFLADLTNIYQELCVGYEYSEKHDLLYPGEQILMTIAYPFPFLPTIVASAFNKTTSDYVPGSALNRYVSDTIEAHYGSHCVIDIYITWGLLGVLLIFYLFGSFVGRVYNNLYDNVFYAAIYVLLMSYAIYIPRNRVVSLIRPILYTVLFVWLNKKQSRNRIISRK